ncbi:MAG: glycosyltransferase family 39 protein [bacterium]|nr:glycosyltransferase family 39 protein [bacterium]
MDNKNKFLILIFLFSLALRLTYNFFLADPDTPPTSDGKYFDKVALNIANGHGFTLPPNNIPTSRKTPAYPFFLAIIYKIFGHSYSIARFFQSIVDALIPIFVYLITIEIFDNKTAMIAAVLSAIDPPLIIFTSQIFSESLLTFITLIFTYFMVKESEKPDLRNAFLAGIFLALSLLTRPIFPFMFIFVFIWKIVMIKDFKKSIIFGTVLVTTSLIVILPWTWRNYQIYKKFVPLTTTVGLTLWLSNDPSSRGASRPQWAMPRRVTFKKQFENSGENSYLESEDLLFSTPEIGRDEKESDDIFLRMSLKKIKEQPSILIKLISLKLIAFWDGFYIWAVCDTVNIKKPIFVIISFALAVPFAIAGAYITRKRWKDVSIFYFLILSVNITGIIFHADYRLRLAVMPYFMILAAVTYNWIIINISNRIKEITL